MPEVTREYAAQVLSALESKGNNLDSVNKQLSTLSADEQKQFFAQAGEKLGLVLTSTEPSRKPLSEMEFRPDSQSSGPISTFIKSAGEALSGISSTTAGDFSRGSAQDMPPGLEGATHAQVADVTRKNLEQAKNENPTAGLLGTATGLAMNAKATDPMFKATINLASEALSSVSGYLGTSAIPGIKKLAGKLIGGGTIEDVGKVMADEGVLSTPSTLGRLKDKLTQVAANVGAKIKPLLQKASAKSMQAQTGEQVVNQAVENWKAFQKTIYPDVDISEKELRLVRKSLEEFFKPKQLYNFEQVNETGSKLLETAWNKANPEFTTAKKMAGIALKKSNTEVIKAKLGDEAAEEILKVSADYNKLAVARDSAAAALEKNPDLRKQMWDFTQGAVLYHFGGAPLAAVGQAANWTVTKTSGAAMARLGSNILKALSANEGASAFAKVAARVYAGKGAKGLVEWHANRMMQSEKYRNVFTSGQSGPSASPQPSQESQP